MPLSEQEIAQKVECWVCGAKPGKPCVRLDRNSRPSWEVRLMPHIPRVIAGYKYLNLPQSDG